MKRFLIMLGALVVCWLRVSGHIPAGMWAEDAVRLGFDEIQHANNRMLDLVALLHRNRARLVADSDGLVGFTLYRELELYVEAGLPGGRCAVPARRVTQASQPVIMCSS